MNLALEFVREKHDGIGSIPLLSEKPELKGKLCPDGAMGAQTVTAEKAADKGADHIMAPERAQGGLHGYQ